MTRLVLLLMLLTGVQAFGQTGSVAEQYLFSALNQERVSRKLAPLRFDSALYRAAVLHAQEMASRRTISHQFAGESELSVRGSRAGAQFDVIAENVAEGPTAVILHDAWMRSPGHRANILDASVDAVGIAVVARDGQLYAVQDFERSVQTLTLQEQEAAVGMLLDLAGIELMPGSDARKTCGMANGYAGEEQPGYVVRYTTADLTALPSRLKTRLATGKDHRAAVGACSTAEKNSFTSYSIAVLLYP